MRLLSLLLVLAVLLGGAIYGFFIEPKGLDASHIRIRGSGLGDDLKGRTLLHLSDLHIARIGGMEQRILDYTEGLKPDFVFLTGDYVEWGGDPEASLEFLSRINARIGVFAVMGDYDYSRSRKSCLFCHEAGTGKPTRRHKVRFLRNEVEGVDLPGGRFWIAGVDTQNGEPSETQKKLGEWKNLGPMVVLSHNPLNFDLLGEDQAVLMLSGDTHGGQIPLPSWLWRILGYEKNAKYNEGLYEKGKKKMVVSRGIGTSHVPFRLFKRPEVVVLHFE